MKNILALCGSNSSNSINLILLNKVVAKIAGYQVTNLNLRDYSLPIYSSDIEADTGIPQEAKDLRKIFTEHDSYIIATPEHNGSIPAFFKNSLDWISRLDKSPMFGNKKPMLLLSTSPGPNGGATNLTTLKNLLPWWGADVKSSYSLGSFYEHFSAGDFDVETNIEIDKAIGVFVKNLAE